MLSSRTQFESVGGGGGVIQNHLSFTAFHIHNYNQIAMFPNLCSARLIPVFTISYNLTLS